MGSTIRRIHATLVFMLDGDKVLLATKGRKMGKGCLNGYGGKVEEGETIVSAAIREVYQECRVKIHKKDLKSVGRVTFYNLLEREDRNICIVHVFITRKWSGKPVSTSEMKNPRWHRISEIGKKKLMLADYDWLPVVLAGKKMTAQAWYGPGQKTLLKKVKVNVL